MARMNRLVIFSGIAIVCLTIYVLRTSPRSERIVSKKEITSSEEVPLSFTREEDQESGSNAVARAKLRLIKAYDEVLPWLKQCAEQNDPDAQFVLGGMYVDGQVVPQDLVEAYKWFSLAARQGEQSAEIAKANLTAKLSQEQLVEATKRISSFSGNLKSQAGSHS